VADLLLQVRALLFKSWSGLNWSEIDALCRRVLALEPDNKLAMKHLAGSLTAHNIVQRGLTRTQVTARYREAGALARRVLAADPNDSQMYNVLSWEAADTQGLRGSVWGRLGQAPWPGKEAEYRQYVEQVLKPAAALAGIAVIAPGDVATR